MEAQSSQLKMKQDMKLLPTKGSGEKQPCSGNRTGYKTQTQDPKSPHSEIPVPPQNTFGDNIVFFPPTSLEKLFIFISLSV